MSESNIQCNSAEPIWENDVLEACLEFMRDMYIGVFGFSFKLLLSTRPEKALGSVEKWNEAEACLQEALNGFDHPWALNPGDGAFYGPKIDITITDALQREHQCATIQLDFQLPERFDLHWIDGQQEKHRPVIVHRAVLGSCERMVAILTESFGGKWPFWLSPRQAMILPVHESFDEYCLQSFVHRAVLGSCERMVAILTESFGGKWPFWLSPRQAMILPVHESFDEYCLQVRDELFAAGFEAEVDLDQSDTLNRKIRNAQLAQFNFILVIGQKELDSHTVNVRTRDNKVRGELSVGDLILRFRKMAEDRTIDNEADWE